MKYFSYILFILILFGCSDGKNTNDAPVKFEKNTELENLEEIDIPPVLYKERKLAVTDNYLVAMSSTKDTLFRVFDRNTLSYLGGFGTEGDGPDDYKPVTSSFEDMNGDRLHVGGLKINRILQLSSGDNPGAKFSHRIIEEQRIPGQIIPWNASFKLNDTIYGGLNFFGFENELTVLNTKTRDLGSVVPFPNFAEHIPSKYFGTLYQRWPKYQASQNKLVTVYTFYPTLRIYDFNNGSVVEKNLEVDHIQPKVRELGDGRNLNLTEMNTYYQKLELSNSHIYALYKAKGSYKSGSEDLSPLELHVFDFEGNPIHKMTLENWMWGFVVSPDDDYLYFWHPDKENKLYRYDLSQIL